MNIYIWMDGLLLLFWLACLLNLIDCMYLKIGSTIKMIPKPLLPSIVSSYNQTSLHANHIPNAHCITSAQPSLKAFHFFNLLISQTSIGQDAEDAKFRK